MRRFHSTITPARVHQVARAALQPALPWRPVGRCVGVTQLLDLLLLMATHTASLFAIVGRFFRFSHETARRTIKANLPTATRLANGLVDALHQVAAFSRKDRRRSWNLAIDTHYVAYYGQPLPALIGGPKKQGTKWFFGYASAVLVQAQRRYTVALGALQSGQKPHQIVRVLLDQIARKGLKIKGVALDSAFDSGETILLLQSRRLAYVVPLRRKGRGANARNRYFEGRHQLIRWAEWTTDSSRRRVRTRVLLWKGKRRTMAFAYEGYRGGQARDLFRQARQQRRHYQRRFGIETSYRQKNQAQAQTTSRDPVYRLLLEGVAYLLRQVWVMLTEQLAGHRPLPTQSWLGELPLRRMLEWLADHIHSFHPEKRSLPIAAPRNTE
jgi:hypothetical protein